MIDEQLEFSISQYADGSLPADEATALEARLAADPAARQLLAEYRGIDAMLKSPAALPVVAWDKLSSHLATAVAAEAEQFEFSISQYADGSLASDESTALETRLHKDTAAQDLLAQDRRLTTLLKTAPLPAIHWDKLSAHLSNTIADAAEPRSIKLFPNRWVRGLGSLALAACLLLASAVGIRTYLAHHGVTPEIAIGPKKAEPVVVAMTPIIVQIGGPEAEVPQGQAVAEITVGAGPGDESTSFAEGIVATSPRSLIASNVAPAQDSAVMPY